MLTDRFVKLMEEYQRRKWYAQVYPDPLDEFIDYVSENILTQLLEEYKRTGNRRLVFAAHYILDILPGVVHPDLLSPFHESLSGISVKRKHKPEYLFYHVKHLPEAEAVDLWNDMQLWSEEKRAPLQEWLQASIVMERKQEELTVAYEAVRSVEKSKEVESLEKTLVSSAEKFEWEYTHRVAVNSFFDMVRYFPESTGVDWNDVSAFAASAGEIFGLEKLPVIRRSKEEPAIQKVYPVSPPDEVILESGESSLPMDLVRFLFELGQGVFYTGMNPKLPADMRISGDESLPYFWGYFYCHALAQPTSVVRLMGHGREALAEELRLMLAFWYRYDSALSIYRYRTDSDLKQAKDLYVQLMEEAFFVPAPGFLYLYDLSRSRASFSRVLAHRHALNTHLYLSILHGGDWFDLPKFRRRFREYRWEGFGLTLSEIMKDLGVGPVFEDPFLKLE